MDNNRLILIVALAAVSYLLWDSWQRDYGPQPVTPVATSSTQTQVPQGSGEVPMAGEVPSAPAASATNRDASVPEAKSSMALKRGQRVEVTTDVFHAIIDTVGGDLRVVDLNNYPVEVKTPDSPIRLLNDRMPNIFVAQSGFAGKRSKSGQVTTASPNHYTKYTVSRDSYTMADGQDSLSVDMTWTSPDGVVFTKRYSFKRGSYEVAVEYLINNRSAKEWRGNSYYQLQRTNSTSISQSQFVYSYMGGVIYSPENKYEKVDFDDMEDANLSRNIKDGWVAMIQHYFLASWIPQTGMDFNYFTRTVNDNERYVLGFKSVQEYSVARGEQAAIKARMFVGPKLQYEMETVAPGLELTVDFGWLTFIAKPIFWLLNWIHDMLGNWGWAIIVLTIIIKLVFYKLSEASYKSMANMRKIHPRLVAIKERCGDDKQKLHQAMMELYKKEKINPLGGCLPILVQIPVFIALYWVLLESVEMRQAPWILWVQDMSRADPYFILPVIMGVTMIAQHKLNPTPLDPMQAKMMMILPFVFTVFFAFFPAGLVLYWVVNNILSIAQQAYITKVVMAEK
ncbi:MAG: membrane protein insertase YidC [Gammaproteobacteria bacterium]|nr:membrane protein insertase YidC [Gammaproteobacteria bacterium]